MTMTTRRMTAEELWRIPHQDQRHELVRGELRTIAPAGFEHGIVGNRINVSLGHFVMEQRLGIVTLADTGFILSCNPDTVRAPDIAFIAQSRISASGMTDRFWPGAPGPRRRSGLARRYGQRA